MQTRIQLFINVNVINFYKFAILSIIMGSHSTYTAMHVDGQGTPKHVAIKIKKLINKYTIVVFDGNYKQFVYLACY
jgi:hypothetical protein